jgi:hypothetical protein
MNSICPEVPHLCCSLLHCDVCVNQSLIQPVKIASPTKQTKIDSYFFPIACSILSSKLPSFTQTTLDSYFTISSSSSFPHPPCPISTFYEENLPLFEEMTDSQDIIQEFEKYCIHEVDFCHLRGRAHSL